MCGGEEVLGGSQLSSGDVSTRKLVPQRCPQDNESSVHHEPTQYLAGPWFNKHKESLFLSLGQCPLTFPGQGPGVTRMNPDQPGLGQCVLPEKPNNLSGWGSEVTWTGEFFGGGLHLSKQLVPHPPSCLLSLLHQLHELVRLLRASAFAQAVTLGPCPCPHPYLSASHPDRPSSCLTFSLRSFSTSFLSSYSTSILAF